MNKGVLKKGEKDERNHQNILLLNESAVVYKLAMLTDFFTFFAKVRVRKTEQD